MASTVDDAADRRQANRAVGWGAAGLAVAGLLELSLALLSGSVALLGDALHNLSDVSTSLLVFVGLPRLSEITNRALRRQVAAPRPHVLPRVGRRRRIRRHCRNQMVARFKLRVGRRIN